MAAGDGFLMVTVGFLGLGKMGLPMALNLRRAGFTLVAYDPKPESLGKWREIGGRYAASVSDVVAAADAVVSILPGGSEHRGLFLGPAGMATIARSGQLLVDCSTTDVALARDIADAAHKVGADAIDAPVSGGVRGAEAATLTFMVGGSTRALDRARPLLGAMGQTVVHTGEAGSGQAAKICNNLMVGISTIGMCEAFALAERLGLAPEMLFEVAKTASAQSWVVSNLCPVPGVVPSAPASNGYRPGGASAMLLKDLQLAQAAARQVGLSSPLGAASESLYQIFCANGGGDLDSSAIIKLLRGHEPTACVKT